MIKDPPNAETPPDGEERDEEPSVLILPASQPHPSIVRRLIRRLRGSSTEDESGVGRGSFIAEVPGPEKVFPETQSDDGEAGGKVPPDRSEEPPDVAEHKPAWVAGVLKGSTKPVHPPKSHDLPVPEQADGPHASEPAQDDVVPSGAIEEGPESEHPAEGESVEIDPGQEDEAWEIRKQRELRDRLGGKQKPKAPKRERPPRSEKKKAPRRRGTRRKSSGETPPLLFGPGSKTTDQERPSSRSTAGKDAAGPTRLSSGHWIDPNEMPVQRTTLKMLPGRLEPLDTAVIQQEVRFLSGPGPIHEVTLGWDLGDPPRHVMLDHPSIQPKHAKMTYWDGRWWIESLSEFYPVEVNGEPLHLSEKPVPLKDGDLVRLGDAIFRYYKA